MNPATDIRALLARCADAESFCGWADGLSALVTPVLQTCAAAAALPEEVTEPPPFHPGA